MHHEKRPRLSLPAIMLAAAVAAPAAVSGAVLGQPLDFAVQVRLDPGEPLAADCIEAEVTVGDRRLAPGAVRAAVEPAGTDVVRIRITTVQPIDEPIVGILLGTGCGSAARLQRRYVVLADPPAQPAAAASPPAPAVADVPLLTTADTARMQQPTAPDGLGTVASADGALRTARGPGEDGSDRSDRSGRADRSARFPAAAPAAAPRRRADRDATGDRQPPPARQRVAARDADDPPRRGRRSGAPAPGAASAAATTDRASAAVAAPPAATAVAAAPPPAPRLRLEAIEPPLRASALGVVEQALQAVAHAASATRAAASAASAAEDRIATLERTVAALRNDARASQEAAAQLRDRVNRSQGTERWLWPLATAVALLVAMAAWLALRLSAAQRERQRLWAQAAAGLRPANPESAPGKLPTAPIPFVTSEIRTSEHAALRAHAGPAWPAPAMATAQVEDRPRPPVRSLPPAPAPGVQPPPPAASPLLAPETAIERTQVLPPLARPGGSDGAGAARDVSIEELIDLEQQAEFFVVLGQEEAAIELLVEHLRHTGGGSPLPYLKLLEIYRRRGDRDDYERMRTRFNHRFNAYAPEWGQDLQAGRTLEDYPGVIPRLQQVWDRPLDAMAELEALLFRKSRGELFDLPAYRDVLFLYSLARDLLDREAATSGDIDLLLPLADGGEFSSTAPTPFLGLPPRETGRHEQDDRPTAPVDFDVSAGLDRPTSIFDPMEAPPARPRRR